MTPETIINLGIGAAGAATAATLVATLMHVWARHKILSREAKFPQTGSRQLGLDPDRPVPPPISDADESDADLSTPTLDPDRPLPPPPDEADQPDSVEESVSHG